MQSQITRKLDKEKQKLFEKINFSNAAIESFTVSGDEIKIYNKNVFFNFLDDYILENCLDEEQDYRCNRLGMKLYQLYDYLIYG